MSKAKSKIQAIINNEKTVLGIEMDSTRIKAVLLDDNNETIATGAMTGRIVL